MDEFDVVVDLSEYLDNKDYRFFVDQTGYSSDRVSNLVDRIDNCEPSVSDGPLWG